MINNNYNNTNNNTTALNKNGNNSNEKEKEENKKLQQQELRLNGIVEKGVSVNTCQRIVWVFNHFVGLALKELNVTSDKTIKKLDDLIKDKPDDLTMLLAPMFFQITLGCCIMQKFKEIFY